MIDGIIDVHTHIVPKSFPANPSPATNTRWPSMCLHGARATIQINDKPFRELDSRAWDIGARLATMAREGIAAQVLSPMPELLSYWFNPHEGLMMAQYTNSVIAEMVATGDSRFFGLGTVPLQDPTLAARELSRLKADGFAGVELGSNINGVVLGDTRFFEFYAEAERLDLALFVHALHPIGAERLSEFPDLIPYAAFPLDTGLAAISLIRAGIPVRFPRLRIGFSHGGGALAPLLYRVQHGWQLTGQFNGQVTQSPRDSAKAFFYDSLVYDASYLQFLLRDFAPGQFFAGTDYPFAIEQTQLSRFLSAATEGAEDQTLIADAARRFLGVTGAA